MTSNPQANSIPIGPFHSDWPVAQHRYHEERIVEAVVVAAIVK